MSVRRKISVILLIVAICAAAPFVNRRLTQRREEATPADLYKVVYTQLNALRAEDYSAAYSQASNGIQHKFNADQFAGMIRTEYSDITTAERVEFGLVICREQRATMQVFFVARDGSVLPCIYTLILEGNDWKIDGARLLPRRPAESSLDEVRA